MTMRRVKSAAIHSVGYDPAARILRLKFHSGHVHDYHGVLPEKHAALLDADRDPDLSVGQFFHAEIRNKHRSSPVQE